MELVSHRAEHKGVSYSVTVGSRFMALWVQDALSGPCDQPNPLMGLFLLWRQTNQAVI